MIPNYINYAIVLLHKGTFLTTLKQHLSLLIVVSSTTVIYSLKESVIKNQHHFCPKLASSKKDARIYSESFPPFLYCFLLISLKYRENFIDFSQNICIQFKTWVLRLSTCFAFFIWIKVFKKKIPEKPADFISQMIMIILNPLLFFLT